MSKSDTSDRTGSGPDPGDAESPSESPVTLPGHWGDLSLVAILLAVMGMSVYRAATQSLTHDEANTCLYFAFKPWHALLSGLPYDANNHVLNTYLIHIAYSIFGPAEWAIRLPALLGGLVVALSLMLWVRRLVSQPFDRVIWFGIVLLNPFMLDFFVAARGYSGAWGFMLAGSYLLFDEALRPAGRRLWPLVVASLFFGIALSFNLSAVYPCTAAVLVFVGWVAPREWRLNSSSRLAGKLVSLILPGPILLGALCAPAFQGVRSEHFYIGNQTPLDSLKGMLEAVYSYNATPVSDLFVSQNIWLTFVSMVLGISIGALLAAVIWSRKAISGESWRRVLLPGLIFVVALGLMMVHITVTPTKWPIPRTVVWVPILLSLCCAALFNAWVTRSGTKGAGGAVKVRFLLLVYLVVVMMQADVQSFYLWRYDNMIEPVMSFLARQPAPVSEVSADNDWRLTPALNFYRFKYSLDWLPPADRQLAATRSTLIFGIHQNMEKPPQPWKGYQLRYYDRESSLVILEHESSSLLEGFDPDP